MHSKHRSPGNGVRSNLMGIGSLAPSRISPEDSIRTHGMFNPDYLNFNRGGFGRGLTKPFPSPSPQQPPRKGDIFMEAGRLAAEYLVSQGFLPPNVLPGKWQNDNSKNQIGDFQEFRVVQDRENLLMTSEGRTSALARLGNIVSDSGGSGRRRFPDEFNSIGSKNQMRGKRRMGSFKGYGYGKNGLWSEKARVYTDMDGEDDDFVSGHHEERRVGFVDGNGGSDPELDNYEFPDDTTGLKTSSSSATKELPSEIDCEFSKGDDTKILNIEVGEVKAEMSNDDEMRKQASVEDDIVMECSSVEVDDVNKNDNDLLQLCNFAKFPTKIRSSLMDKGSKVDTISTNDEGNTCDSDASPQEGSKVPIEEDNIGNSSSVTLTNQSHNSRCFESVQSVEDVGDLGTAYALEGGECASLQSFPESSFIYEQASVRSPPELGRCSSMVKGRGEKRALQDDNMGEGTKKPREWPSSMVEHDNEYFHLDTFSAKPSKADEEVMVASEQERLLDVAMFSKGGAESGLEFREEKQLFPSSFKICDLNLMEASDMTESHDSDPVLDLPSTFEAKKEERVDVDLTISNSCNRSNDYGRRSADAKDVALVDVPSDSEKEEKAFDASERTNQTVHPSMECFPNHTENTGDLPDGQDGYGLMISELLGTDIPNCSSVPADITSLDTEMGLHNGVGILGDDDQIFLSLGEIPISFLGVWEPPTQQYEKPF